MDKQLVKNILSRFDNFSFKKFTLDFFEKTRSNLKAIDSIKGDDVYYGPLLDSYGGSIHSVFIYHFIPLEVFKKTKDLKIINPILDEYLRNVQKLYKGQYGQFGMVSPHLRKAKKLASIAFLTNFSGYSREEYDEILFPQYSHLIDKLKIETPLFLGSIDSYIDNDYEKIQTTFRDFINSNIDGISFSIQAGKVNAQIFYQEKNLLGGLLKEKKQLYEPVFTIANTGTSILNEFESLLENNVSESKIEMFLTKYYSEIFGFQYDRIETQLWLRFPELDINKKNRRIDILLRNSLDEDWELFEIKKPSIKLTSSYRDVPVLAAQITHAMQQLKNYKRTMNQEKVKKHFMKSGIEYFEPTLNLVVGRNPQINTEQWRWLKSENENSVKIITFDDLINEMKLRIADRNKLYSA